ncbi:MAG: DUF1028 domain-containing protein [Clostridia bacterium]|nr:DUF1028 domain-containing protein [Clostridia bacterium]
MKDVIATYSIVAADPENDELGIAVQSKFLAVGNAVPWAKAGVGAVATQSWANTSFGPRGLELLEKGHTPQEALNILLEDDGKKEYRQVGIVDAKGNAASFTGKECFPWAGGVTGENYACQGNILVNEETVTQMAEVFEKSQGDLASRLLEALDAAQDAGGDSRGMQSAAILVVKPEGGYGGFNDRFIDLRVDDHPNPIKELMRIYDLHKLYFTKTDPDRIRKIEGDVEKKIAKALIQLDYFQGAYSGNWTEELQEALKTYYLTENFDDRIAEDGYIDGDVLDFMMNQVK